MSIKVEETLKFMVEEASVDPTKIRDFIKRFGTQEIRLLLSFCQQNVSKDLPKRNYGLVHQDLVNILGEKLGFKVTFGDYQKGPDGTWGYKDVTLVIESKTSPTWLEIKQASDYVKDEKATSGLIICPFFTEDNIKAAGGYGNVRLLTADGLCKLTELKDEGLISTEDIMSMLIPQETVKLDYLVNIIYKIRTKPEAEVEVPKELPVISREELALLKEGNVVICPSKPEGVNFLLKYRAWGFIKIGKKPEYFALYVSHPESKVSYFGEVKDIVYPKNHGSPITEEEAHQYKTFKEGKKVIVLKPNSLRKLKEGIPKGIKKIPQGIKYVTLSQFINAKTLDDL